MVDQFGRIDILFSNVGIAEGGLIGQMSEEDGDRILDTNLKGVLLCAKYVVPHMMDQGSGRIIN